MYPYWRFRLPGIDKDCLAIQAPTLGEAQEYVERKHGQLFLLQGEVDVPDIDDEVVSVNEVKLSSMTCVI